jgi:myo-inositol-1(or 4)-monophosphatase
MKVPSPAQNEAIVPIQEISERVRLADTVIRDAGALAADFYHRRAALSIERKGVQDFVSEADRACEKLIVAALTDHFPEDGFLGEESGLRSGGNLIWVVDPIDGTDNFLRGIPFWCVSIGLVADRQALLGYIYNPVTEELFSAVKGGGAFLNGEAIRVSDTADVERARICLGFSYRRPVAPHARVVKALLDAHCEYSRLGSGALGVAYTAAGRFDAYWEHHINAWDVAAGLAIVSEAGGVTNDFLAGDGMQRGNEIFASTPALAPKLRAIIETALAG